MSMREALCVRIDNIRKHDNSDNLSIIMIGGYQVVVKTEDFKIGDLAIYITPDTIVDSTKEPFSFLVSRGDKVKIRAAKFRGVYSQGLLIKAHEGAEENCNYYSYYDLSHYEPEMEFKIGGDFAKPPEKWGSLSRYDIENARSSKVRNWFINDEPVWVTYKLHGSNCSFVYSDGEIFVRSRSGFRSKENNIFWNALDNTPQVEEFCKSHPDILIYGETYGQNKGFKYDCDQTVKFRIFDMMRQDRSYLHYNDLLLTCKTFDLPLVPEVGIMKFNYEELLQLAESPCPLGNKISEGLVFRTIKERVSADGDRCIAKIVSNQYLEKSK